jgi:hypothetical protein
VTRPEWWRLAAFAFVVAVGAWGLWQLQDTTDELHDLVRSEAHEDEVEDAEACVSQHARYGDLIRAIEGASAVGAQVGTDAHLDLLESTETERHDAHRYINRRLPSALEPVFEGYPPPACDAEAARQLLEDG